MGCVVASPSIPLPATRCTHLVRTEKGALHVALAPHNAMLAATSKKDEAEVVVWDLRAAGTAGREFKRLRAEGKISCLAFSPDGSSLLAAARHELRLFRLPDCEAPKTLEVPRETVCRAAFSPDSKHVAALTTGGVCIVWEPESGREVRFKHSGKDGRAEEKLFSGDALDLQFVQAERGEGEGGQGHGQAGDGKTVLIGVATATGASLWRIPVRSLEGAGEKDPVKEGAGGGAGDAAISPAEVERIWFPQSPKTTLVLAIGPEAGRGVLRVLGERYTAGSTDHEMFRWGSNAGRRLFVGGWDLPRIPAVARFTPGGRFVVMAGTTGLVGMLGLEDGKSKAVSGRDKTNHRMTVEGGHRAKINGLSVGWWGVATASDDWSCRVFDVRLSGAPRGGVDVPVAFGPAAGAKGEVGQAHARVKGEVVGAEEEVSPYDVQNPDDAENDRGCKTNDGKANADDPALDTQPEFLRSSQVSEG
eukprot:CAMPEP_0114517354 /NCGR_PEP_ID=MMETSP0109-20121206/17845_1 /TAXON_ID=29199 /ORGANISM="Chlorarachnion reptans, Strain CCCM449" /LENGTH=474 /DNA_ID=CAMNT_0001697861 /DNA_START=121 /DNA_END=1546 /DNA_ORIENTATION=-